MHIIQFCTQFVLGSVILDVLLAICKTCKMLSNRFDSLRAMARLQYPITRLILSLEATRLVVWIIASLRNLTGTSDCQITERSDNSKHKSRGFITISCDRTSYWILKQSHGGCSNLGYPWETPRENLFTQNLLLSCQIVLNFCTV